jgi:hypothetical protein
MNKGYFTLLGRYYSQTLEISLTYNFLCVEPCLCYLFCLFLFESKHLN